ncbi:MAG: hypothetical protein NZZ41_00360 [Candidatus Dojkabacteria bacterium]|nr:hypothetical protein [Candidatus Dojkabacteria bacterium]
MTLRELLDLIYLYCLVFLVFHKAEKSGRIHSALRKYYAYTVDGILNKRPKNDLSLLVTVFFDVDQFLKLKNYNENIKIASLVRKFIPDLIAYLKGLYNRNLSDEQINSILMRLESKLLIDQDYKDLRRVMFYWDTECTIHAKRVICTRLMQAVQHKGESSGRMDVYYLYRDWHKGKNYSMKTTYNAEFNKPDDSSFGKVSTLGVISGILSAIAGFAVGYKSGKN